MNTEIVTDINLTNGSLEKGVVRNKTLIAWDCIQNCDVDRCPIGQHCMYAKHNDKCQLQVAYLESLTDMLFNTYKYVDEDTLFKIGMHLVPLYSMLCRQKIVEKSVTRLAYEDVKGVTRIHPIYKEIRETMKTITMIWKEMGFGRLDPDLPPTGKEGFGDPSHFRNISQNADNKRDVIR